MKKYVADGIYVVDAAGLVATAHMRPAEETAERIARALNLLVQQVQNPLYSVTTQTVSVAESQRFESASANLAALLSCGWASADASRVTNTAVAHADALLAALGAPAKAGEQQDSVYGLEIRAGRGVTTVIDPANPGEPFFWGTDTACRRLLGYDALRESHAEMLAALEETLNNIITHGDPFSGGDHELVAQFRPIIARAKAVRP